MTENAITCIKVISLDTSVDRRQAFMHMAGQTKLDWAFFSAYTSLPEPLQYDDRIATRRFGRPLSPSEIGCYASHFKVWEWLTNSNYDQAIIFEDDILVEWTIIETLARTNLNNHGIQLLRLHVLYPSRCQIVKYRLISPNTHLVRIIGSVPGALAYVITKPAARTLVSRYSVAAAPLDWILARYWEHRILSYCFFPFPVLERLGPSTIGDQRHVVSQRAAVYDRIARIGWRIRDRGKRAFVEHCTIRKYPLGPTKDSGAPFIRAPGF